MGSGFKDSKNKSKAVKLQFSALSVVKDRHFILRKKKIYPYQKFIKHIIIKKENFNNSFLLNLKMFISYENDEIRECCLLLGSTSSFSIFSSDQIKEIRAIIADLKAAPKLKDIPLKYTLSIEKKSIEIEHGKIKILGEIITKSEIPNEVQINRIKIIDISNIELQSNSLKGIKYN